MKNKYFISNLKNDLSLPIELNDLLIFLVDNSYDYVINDITPIPHIEYDLEDIVAVWDNLKLVINF
ncbi:MAG: hypothetical protein M0R03_20770 [Novosphingobium sp.]|nr:hypothetical protein [Novosphingobium sp.]